MNTLMAGFKILTFALIMQVCKNMYLLAWAHELVNQGQFESVCFFYVVVGHTKFEPDRLLLPLLRHSTKAISELYPTSYMFRSSQVMQWRSILGEKCCTLRGITNLHDFDVSQIPATSVLKCRSNCYSGSYKTRSLKKPHYSEHCCNLQS